MASEYISADVYCRRVFGQKVYKLALSASTTCPNRDGTKGNGGCIFCSRGGSGDFAADAGLSVPRQLARAKEILGKKGQNTKYIAYFQSFTGTYGDLDKLEEIYTEAAGEENIVGLSIATRPDCLDAKAMEMLSRLSDRTTLWVELGLQTIHDGTAEYINRAYQLTDYDEALRNLRQIRAHIITHVILGLPHESREDMLESVQYVGERSDGIKLQLLHVLEGTKLAELYRQQEFKTLSMDEYCALLADAVMLLPKEVVIHRLTGDGAKKELIAPLWSADKKRVLSAINREFAARDIRKAEK